MLQELSSAVKKINQDLDHFSSDVFQLKGIVKRLDQNDELFAPVKEEMEEMMTKFEKLNCDHDDLFKLQDSTKVNIKSLSTELAEVKQQLGKLQKLVDSNLQVTSVEVSSGTMGYILNLSCPKSDSQKRRLSWPSADTGQSLTLGKIVESLSAKVKSIEEVILQTKHFKLSKSNEAFITGLKKLVEQQIEKDNKLKQGDSGKRDRTSKDSGYLDSSIFFQSHASTPQALPPQSKTSTPSLSSKNTVANSMKAGGDQSSTIRKTLFEEETFDNDLPQTIYSLPQTSMYHLGMASTSEYIHDPRLDMFLESLHQFLVNA